MRREAIRLARVSPGVVQCHICKTKIKENEKPKLFDVDHARPAADPIKSKASWDEWIDGLFCSAEGLRILCKPCHKEKTARENLKRISPVKRKARSGSKKRC